MPKIVKAYMQDLKDALSGIAVKPRTVSKDTSVYIRAIKHKEQVGITL